MTLLGPVSQLTKSMEYSRILASTLFNCVRRIPQPDSLLRTSSRGIFHCQPSHQHKLMRSLTYWQLIPLRRVLETLVDLALRCCCIYMLAVPIGIYIPCNRLQPQYQHMMLSRSCLSTQAHGIENARLTIKPLYAIYKRLVVPVDACTVAACIAS